MFTAKDEEGTEVSRIELSLVSMALVGDSPWLILFEEEARTRSNKKVGSNGSS
jgi:hypothetical protein